ncbi:MAG: 5-formyltetrahydrofolate cyclo-ligase [Lachnospiraceae bacterium]|nr:5-formyltetrahydrofolate cyclo-ligase [Lachnospiraceae bacterium]
MNEGKIARINELYHKSKAEGLTPKEKEEQKKLRKEYIEAIRGNMRATLDHTSIQNEDGTLTPLRIVRQNNLAKKNVDTDSDFIKSNNYNVESIEEIRQKKITEHKKRIRKELTEKRNALSEREVKQRSGIICYHVLQSEEYKNASSVCVYQAFRNEVSCDDIIDKAYEDGKQVFVPVVDDDKKTMDFYEITTDTEWTEGSYGIKEPVITNEMRKLTEADNVLVIMPGLVFDKNKHRIGYGGGYYDKFLNEHMNYTKMALCYSFQIVDYELPYDEQDVLPDHIVTEDGVI